MERKEHRQPEEPKRGGAFWGSGISRKRPGPGRGAVLGSLSFHLLLLIGLIASGFSRVRTPEYEVYRVKLYSPPPQVAAPQQQEVKSASPIVAPKAEVATAPKREAPRSVVPRPTRETDKPAERKSEPVRGPKPDPKSAGGENLDVDIAGQDFPYPDYLENIVIQLNRYFRWEGNPTLRANVVFYINRDGSVGGLDISQRSGDIRFDLKALDAVQQVARRGLFGPLPTGWVQDRLPISIQFVPPK
jgi:hypothetical protein